MYYLPFDRLMGLWIINEFLKLDLKLMLETSMQPFSNVP